MGDSGTLVRFGTQRRDAWWLEIVPVIVVLGTFGAYATLRAFEGKFYEWGPYLSPFYSPLIDAGHRWWPFSPALLILAGPLGFRATCYYYRKAYYRAFFLDPPGCAVNERRGKYKGETAFPLVLQNLHRYFFWLALVFIAFLWKDAVVACRWSGHFGVGVGTVVMLINVILLSCYLLSCHSLRHMVGGKVDCFSCVAFGGARHASWKGASWLNSRHMLWAWLSLFSVGLTDLYIRLVSAGVIQDVRIL
ncbi:MAG: hypothetical protein NVS9B15_15770 [Acidobacteriaceae bacterium]